jgi:23S rRNA (adenine2503-C2)-methyltransferase
MPDRGKKLLCGMDPDEIKSLASCDISAAKVITNSLYKKRITDIIRITGISKQLKDYLSEVVCTGLLNPVSCQKSSDGSIKYLFRNNKLLEYETVFLPGERRNTVCVSTQAGCKMGCPFCVSGKYGFRGDLSAGDIINQVISLPESGILTHVVFMGMGEPMDNLDNVIKACYILTAEWGRAISRRNITVSTVGITSGIRKFLEFSDCNLVFSLFSPFEEERRNVIPAERKYPAHEIINLMKSYPLQKRRRLSIAYVMIDGINDSDKHLEGLKVLLKNSMIRVNLLKYHQHPYDDRTPSTMERLQYFKHELITSGVSASIRRSRGEDISAACGLLAAGLKADLMNSD